MADYTCVKCGSTSFEKGEIRTAGGGLSKLIDVQNKKFFSVSCSQCGYTEFYKKTSSAAGNIADFFLG